MDPSEILTASKTEISEKHKIKNTRKALSFNGITPYLTDILVDLAALGGSRGSQLFLRIGHSGTISMLLTAMQEKTADSDAKACETLFAFLKRHGFKKLMIGLWSHSTHHDFFLNALGFKAHSVHKVYTVKLPIAVPKKKNGVRFVIVNPESPTLRRVFFDAVRSGQNLSDREDPELRYAVCLNEAVGYRELTRLIADSSGRKIGCLWNSNVDIFGVKTALPQLFLEGAYWRNGTGEKVLDALIPELNAQASAIRIMVDEKEDAKIRCFERRLFKQDETVYGTVSLCCRLLT